MSGYPQFEMSGYPSISQRRPSFSQSLRRLISQHFRWLTAFAIFLSLLFIWSIVAKYRHPKERQPSPAFFGPQNTLTENARDGFLSLREARHVCQRRRWEPYATRDRRRKVYDLFLINTELDFLEIRLHELDSEVDYFVILESGMPFFQIKTSFFAPNPWRLGYVVAAGQLNARAIESCRFGPQT